MSRHKGLAGWKTLKEGLTGRQILWARAQSGPEVYVAPMPGFAMRYAVCTARFGSLDERLPDGTKLPEGTAHFLEHKMFQSDEGDLFDIYSARGASANAYTTFGHTSYLFGATRQFDENLETLLGCMSSITTDAASIERERGIIGQEIAMYADEPSWRGWFGLLQALFSRHPARLDIAGSARSIAGINKPLLERVFNAGYAPANLVLCVAGDVDAPAILEAVNRVLGQRPVGRRSKRKLAPEPRTVATPEARLALSVQRPQVWWGLKDSPPPKAAKARLRREVLTRLALDTLFGDGGRVQAPLYREGIADDSFSAAYESEEGAAFAVIHAEVDSETGWRERLPAACREALKKPLTPAEVERCRRRMLGRHLRTFDAPERVAHWMQGLALEEVGPDDGVAALRALRAPAVNRRLRELFASPSAWSVVEPLAPGRSRKKS